MSLKIYRINDDTEAVLMAASPDAFLAQLRLKDHTPTATLEAYKEELRSRLEVQTGVVLPSPTTSEALVSLLESAGLITVLTQET